MKLTPDTKLVVGYFAHPLVLMTVAGLCSNMEMTERGWSLYVGIAVSMTVVASVVATTWVVRKTG